MERTINQLPSVMELFESHDPDLRYNAIREVSKLLEMDPKAVWYQSKDLSLVRQLFYSLSEDPNPEVMSMAGDCLELVCRSVPAYQITFLVCKFVNNLEEKEIFEMRDANLTWFVDHAAENIEAPIGQENDRDIITTAQRKTSVVLVFERILKAVNPEILISTIGPFLVSKLSSLFKSVVDVTCPFADDIVYTSDVDLIKCSSSSIALKARPNIFAWIKLYIAMLSWRDVNICSYNLTQAACEDGPFSAMTLASPLQANVVLCGSAEFPSLVRNFAKVLSHDCLEFYLDYNRLIRMCRFSLEESLPYMRNHLVHDLVLNIPLTMTGDHFLVSLVTFAPSTVATSLDENRILDVVKRLKIICVSPDPGDSLEALNLFVNALMKPLDSVHAYRAKCNGWITQRYGLVHSLEDELKADISSDFTEQKRSLREPIVRVCGLKLFNEMQNTIAAQCLVNITEVLLHCSKFENSCVQVCTLLDDLGDFEVDLDDLDLIAPPNDGDGEVRSSPIIFAHGSKEAKIDILRSMKNLTESMLLWLRTTDCFEVTNELLVALWSLFAHILSHYSSEYHLTCFLGLELIWDFLTVKCRDIQILNVALLDRKDCLDEVVLETPLLWLDMIHHGVKLSFCGYSVTPNLWPHLLTYRNLISNDTLATLTGSLLSERNLRMLLHGDSSVLRTLCSIYEFDFDFGRRLLEALKPHCGDLEHLFTDSGILFYYVMIGGKSRCQDGDIDKANSVDRFAKTLLLSLTDCNLVDEVSSLLSQLVDDEVLSRWICWVLQSYHGRVVPTTPPASWTYEGAASRDVESICFDFLQQCHVLTTVNPNEIPPGCLLPQAAIFNMCFDSSCAIYRRDKLRSVLPVCLFSTSRVDRMRFFCVDPTSNEQVPGTISMVPSGDEFLAKITSLMESIEGNLPLDISIQVMSDILGHLDNKELMNSLLISIENVIDGVQSLPDEITTTSVTHQSDLLKRREDIITAYENALHVVERFVMVCQRIEAVHENKFLDTHYQRICSRSYPHDTLAEVHAHFVHELQALLHKGLRQLVAEDSKLISKQELCGKIFISDLGDPVVCHIINLLRRTFTWHHRVELGQYTDVFEFLMSAQIKERHVKEDDRPNITCSNVSPTIQQSCQNLMMMDSKSSALFELLITSRCHSLTTTYSDSINGIFPRKISGVDLFGGYLSVTNCMKDQSQVYLVLLCHWIVSSGNLLSDYNDDE
eukprot:GHVH01011282.1.p1 GENE.GHVH01011282.1~~GHVH01011282.1.p1  ORF type:complete len:1213 (+),score=158.59 GHVH01011282.1:55-3693(+)